MNIEELQKRMNEIKAKGCARCSNECYALKHIREQIEKLRSNDEVNERSC